MKVVEAQNLLNIIDFFNNQCLDQNLSLPAGISYALFKNENKIKSTLKVYESKRLDLVKKHASKDKDGAPKLNKEKTEFVIKNKKSFDKEYNEMIMANVEIDFHKFPSVETIIENTSGEQKLLNILWNLIEAMNNVEIKANATLEIAE